MSQLVRVQQKIFGSTGPTTEFAQIGSLAAAAVLKTKDLAQIQALGQYDAGLYAITNSASEPPRIQDLNSLYFMTTTQLEYMFQTGIPEWETNTEYYQNVGYVQKAGVLYRSIRATVNQGIDPASDSGVNWGGPLMAELTTTGQTILARDGGGVVVGSGSLVSGAKLLVSDAVGTLPSISGNTSVVFQRNVTTTTPNYLTIIGGSNTISGLNVGDAESEVSGRLLYNNLTNSWAFYTATVKAMTITLDQNILLGTTINSGPRLVVADGVGSFPTIEGATTLLLQNNNSTTTSNTFQMVSGNQAQCRWYAGDESGIAPGRMIYDHSDNSWRFHTSGIEAIRLTSTNHLLLNTTSDPGEILHVNGSARFTGSIDNTIIDSTGLLTASRATIGTITATLSLITDNISEKTASAGVTLNSNLIPTTSPVDGNISANYTGSSSSAVLPAGFYTGYLESVENGGISGGTLIMEVNVNGSWVQVEGANVLVQPGTKRSNSFSIISDGTNVRITQAASSNNGIGYYRYKKF